MVASLPILGVVREKARTAVCWKGVGIAVDLESLVARSRVGRVRVVENIDGDDVGYL